MLQELGEKFAEQAAVGPLCAVFEAGDQRVHREAVNPRRDHPLERRRLVQALATGQPRCRQGQGAGLAMIAKPRQFGFAIGADGRGFIG
ncbi:hypothetical protein D3C73_1293700 [compost metagenome]